MSGLTMGLMSMDQLNLKILVNGYAFIIYNNSFNLLLNTVISLFFA